MRQERHTESEADNALCIQKAVGGNSGAFGKLYDMYVDRVYRHVYYRVGNVADAEDLTQQVFLKAWQAIGRYRKAASPFIAWLITISHNLVVDFYRTRKDKVYLDAEVVASDLASGPERVTEAHFEQQRLRRAIQKLHGEQQQVVLLRFIEGFGYEEIAALMGKREGTIRVIQHRALANMKHILEEEMGK